ncbi:MAG: glycosyltransferase [Prevotella sp.]|nr:glycosyltransferase [Prevotella sp.]
MKRLSIIIVTYKSENDIYDCLTSIRNHSDIATEELELIIVDNSPESDKMFKTVRQRFGDDILLIKNTRNGGYGQGNNIGIRMAKAPVTLIMNPDVRLMEPVFLTALKAFEKDSQLSMYGMKQMLSPTEPSTNSFACTNMMNGYLATILTAISNRIDHYFARFMYFSGSCFFIRKQMFEEIGLFDDDIFMYGEEDDIHHRMKKRLGCHMTYNPHLHYIHLTKERKPDLEYEKRVFNSVCAMLQKKEYPKESFINNRLQSINLQLWREQLRTAIGKGNPSLLNMLKDFRKYLKTLD